MEKISMTGDESKKLVKNYLQKPKFTVSSISFEDLVSKSDVGREFLAKLNESYVTNS